MATWTNCAGMTRRDCLRLGLGTLFGGGLAHALRLRAGGRRSDARPAGEELHPHLDGRRADALRDVRSQAGRPEGDPRRVRAIADEGPRRPLLAST